jgi:hypothetical protein
MRTLLLTLALVMAAQHLCMADETAPPYKAKDNLKSSDYAFFGRVVEITVLDGQKHNLRYKFKVQKVWKGNAGPYFQVYAGGEITEHNKFAINEEYMVYAKGKTTPVSDSSLRTASIQFDADRHMKELGKPIRTFPEKESKDNNPDAGAGK